jgi:amino acid transporter
MDPTTTAASDSRWRRAIGWIGAFWLSSGAPLLVIIVVGPVGAAAGLLAFAIWAVAVVLGCVQAFTYAEIAGLFPNKSGGAALHGAAAWIRYWKLAAPLTVWCAWLAWMPVLVLASASGADAAIQAMAPELALWNLLHLEIEGLVTISIGTRFAVGAGLALLVFAVQFLGTAGAARLQAILGTTLVAALLALGAVLLLKGRPIASNLSFGESFWNDEWSVAWAPVLAALFIAVRWTAAFDGAAGYNREVRTPESDTPRAIFYASLLSLVIFVSLPLAFQAALGVAMSAPDIATGTGLVAAIAARLGAGATVAGGLQIGVAAACFLAAMTALASSSRILCQGSMDGWLPRYLSRTNRHGAPVSAMGTGLVVTLALLAVMPADGQGNASLLIFSSICYLVFSFFALTAGWIHRADSGHIRRSYRASTFVLGLAIVVAFLNAALLGAGAALWGMIPDVATDLRWASLIAIVAILPAFYHRHYVQDGGRFPPRMMEDLGLREGQGLGERKAGLLPYLTLAGGIAVVILSAWLFHR